MLHWIGEFFWGRLGRRILDRQRLTAIVAVGHRRETLLFPDAGAPIESCLGP